ncbi:MAG: aminotransferase class I/II-fold pyridoxal phosphate-dependent enzyme, partial [Oscillospiraceae bacterium]|nr:aminotransferase class I/II-fold pyridoxal phosphate-dependent enzyme [Oscillospiraceae bacterium]
MIYKKTGHGGDIYGKSVVCDFSANVNPLGTPDSVRRAVIDSALRVQNYPDPCCRALRDKIAEYEGVSEDCIMCSNGAAELIFSFCAALKPQKVLELAPTFSEYSEAVLSVGGKVERYMLKKENDFALTEAFLSYIELGSWDVLFLCSPNNPTGRLIEPRLLEKILDICRQKKMRLFLDECFLELSDDGGKNSMKRFLDAFPELFILK